MRKKFLTITTSVLVTLSLASCNESSSIPTSKPTSDNPTSETPTSEVVAPAVPTEEGKVTFYFTKDEANSVAFASYESVYVVGTLNGWKTGAESLPYAFTKLENEDVYYVLIDAESASTSGEYKMMLGYNETSGLPESSQGLLWTQEAQGYPDDVWGPGSANSTYTVEEGKNTVDLGTYKWSNHLDEPVIPEVKLQNFNLNLHFAVSVKENYHVYIMGDFNTWSAPLEMTATNDTRTEYTYKVTEEKAVGNYGFKVVVHPKATTDEGFNVWNGGYEVITQNGTLAIDETFIEGSNHDLLEGLRMPHNGVEHIYSLEKDASVTVIGKLTKHYTGTSNHDLFIGDRGFSTYIFGASAKAVEDLNEGDVIKVTGIVDIFNGLYEVKGTREKPLSIEKVDVKDVVAYDYGITDPAALKNTDQGKLCHVTGTLKADITVADNSDVKFVVVIEEGKEINCLIKKKDSETKAKVQGLVAGTKVKVEGVIGWYNSAQVAPVFNVQVLAD